jgi:hypothetical protein
MRAGVVCVLVTQAGLTMADPPDKDAAVLYYSYNRTLPLRCYQWRIPQTGVRAFGCCGADETLLGPSTKVARSTLGKNKPFIRTNLQDPSKEPCSVPYACSRI